MTENPKPIVIPQGLTLSYRPGKVVAMVPRTIELPSTGLTFLVGANGEGKTTLMRYLCGLLKRHPIGTGRGMYLPDEMQFPPSLPIHLLLSALFGKKSAEYNEAITIADDLWLDSSRPYGTLSQGNRQKAKLVVGLVEANRNHASLLCLDEPFSGLDYKVRRKLWQQFERYRYKRHLLVSIHADKIVVTPDKLIAVNNGLITEYPGISTEDEIETILDGNRNLVTNLA